MDKKPSIMDLERRMDNGEKICIQPNGEVVTAEKDASTRVRKFNVFVGDEYAKIWWGGKHWVHMRLDAKNYLTAADAFAVMEKLRGESTPSTIRVYSYMEEAAGTAEPEEPTKQK